MAGRGIGVAGVIGRRARHLLAVGVVRIVAHGDPSRFEDQHRGERRTLVAGVAQDRHGRSFGDAREAEFAVFDDRRVEDGILFVEQVYLVVGAGDGSLDGVFVFVSAAAQHGGRRCEDQDLFHCIFPLIIINLSN